MMLRNHFKYESRERSAFTNAIGPKCSGLIEVYLLTWCVETFKYIKRGLGSTKFFHQFGVRQIKEVCSYFQFWGCA